jgi:hypothetical protein
MFCPKCGVKLENADADSCPECGVAIRFCGGKNRISRYPRLVVFFGLAVSLLDIIGGLIRSPEHNYINIIMIVVAISLLIILFKFCHYFVQIQ